MSRPKDPQAAADLGRALTSLWEAADRPSFGKMARQLVTLVGEDEAVSDQTLIRMHRGEIDPRNVGIETLAGLASIYGAGTEDFGLVAGSRLRAVRELVSQNLKILGTGGDIDLRDSTIADRRHDDGLKIAV